MKKRLLITGAAGFLGSHLCDKFIAEEFHVIGMDNFITGDKKNISHLANQNNFSFIEHDVTEYIKIDGQLDYILHFASPASPIDYLKIPLETLRVGSLGTENVLKIALKNNARILIASTSEVYGDPLVHPQPEEYFGNVDPVGPRGVYDEAKRFQEALTTAYHTFHGLDIRIARIFNTYGSRMRVNDGRAIPAFMGQVLRGESLTVFGDGSQTRSFCYVDDLVEGMIRMMATDDSFIGPVNLGNPNEFTMLELAESVLKLTDSKSKIVYMPLPQDDPTQRQPDISLAYDKLNGWKPEIELEDGLKNTIKYFKETISLND